MARNKLRTERGPSARHVGGGKQREERAKGGHPGEPSDEDILQDGQPAKETELLEDEADAGPDPVQFLGNGPADPRPPPAPLPRRLTTLGSAGRWTFRRRWVR